MRAVHEKASSIGRGFFVSGEKKAYFSLLTIFVSLDLLFDATFLWITPLAASWSRSFTVFSSSGTPCSLSLAARTRLIAVRIRDFSCAFRVARRFAIRARFSADACCAIP